MASSRAEAGHPLEPRFVPLRIDHLVLPSDDGRQDFLLLALVHIQVVERTADLRSDPVELLGRDVESR